jgi:RNA polymerase primary sigma factor
MRQLKIVKQVTNRETPSLDKYLHEIGKVELTSEEEVQLVKIEMAIKRLSNKLIKQILFRCFRFQTIPESGLPS